MSWLGRFRFEGCEYPYVECSSCFSLYAARIPDEAALSRMYGEAYAADAGGGEGVRDPKDPASLIGFLEQLPHGTFIDYGCGDGSLLIRAASLEWSLLGVEFDRHVAIATARRTGLRIHDRSSVASLPDGMADVIHLGDVVEHLTAPAAELRHILRLLKHGGYLVAQGPLEANTNLFTAALKTWKKMAGPSVSNMPPYHLLLATRIGQEALFNRVGLQTRRFEMTEVEWPAPSRLHASDLLNIRSVALFLLRRVSQGCSALRPRAWGNRYFYVGQVV
jgi:SAM-dependent methyltransferase